MTATKGIKMNEQETVDKYQQVMKIDDKIPKEWGQWISCDKGWYDIIIELDKQLTYLMPNYYPTQIKEKFGTLRYYWEPNGVSMDIWPMIDEITTACTQRAEWKSSQTCEICGVCTYMSTAEKKYDLSVKLTVRGGWYKTLCSTCAKEKGYQAEMEAEDEEV